MQSFLLNLETEFYFLTGMDLEGLSGLVFGLLIFCLILFLIRFEKKREPLIHDVDLSNEIGNEKIFNDLFPTKEIVMIETSNINYGGGNIHCITMNVPKI